MDSEDETGMGSEGDTGMESEDDNRSTIITIAKLNLKNMKVPIRKFIQQIMSEKPKHLVKGKKRGISETSTPKPNAKGIVVVHEQHYEEKTVGPLKIHTSTYTVVREKDRFPALSAASNSKAKRIKQEYQHIEKENESSEVEAGSSSGKKAALIDQNHGRAKFIWYETETGIEAFAQLDPGLSNLWMKLLPIRDKSFGTRLARNLLDSKQVLKAEFVNLLGNNMGKETISFKNPMFSQFSIKEKYGMVKTFTSKLRSEVLKGEDFKKLKGEGLISTSRCWEIQSGQIKIPVKKSIVNRDQLLRIFPLLVHFAEKVDGDDSWDFLDYVQQLDNDDPRAAKCTELIKEELIQCTNAEISGDEYNPRSFDINNKLRAHVSISLSDAYSATLIDGDEQVPWANGEYERDGLNITVNDVICAVARARRQIEKVSLKYYTPNFSPIKPIHELVETQIQREDGSILKVGNQYYKVNPTQNHHMGVNIKFLEVLKTHLVGEEYSEHFPLPWHCTKKDSKEKTTKKSASKSTAQHFNLDDLVKVCFNSTVSSEVKTMVVQILTDDIVFVDAANTTKTNRMYREDMMNCSLMKSSKLAKLCPKLSYLLANEVDITEEKLKNSLSYLKEEEAKQIMENLTQKRKVCRKVSKNQLAVVDPHLTIEQVEKLKAIPGSRICIPRLIQFLRMQLQMDEGQYNELYLLSNCPCHSGGWVFLVLDRVEIHGNIEICDVLAYNKKESLVVLLHVKEGADANKARAVCSQVRVSCEEINRSLTIDQDPDVFQMIFNRATNPPEMSLYRQSLKSTIEDNFDGEEDFVTKMRASKFDICMAVADNNASRWKEMKNINLKKDVSDVVDDPEMLKAFTKLGYLTKRKKQITQKMIDTPKEQIANDVKEAAPDIKKTSIIKTITDVFIKITRDGTAEFLRGNFISRMIINDLHDTFQGLMEQNVRLRIMPIPVDV